MNRNRRTPPPPRPTEAEWPRWTAALQALKVQAQIGAAMLPGNPIGAQMPDADRIAKMRSEMGRYEQECKGIIGLLLSGRLGPDTTIPDLTDGQLRAVWNWS